MCCAMLHVLRIPDTDTTTSLGFSFALTPDKPTFRLIVALVMTMFYMLSRFFARISAILYTDICIAC